MEEFPVSLNENREEKSGLFSSIALIVIAALFVILLTFNALYTRIYIVGSSMQTTLTGANSTTQVGGDYVYICKYLQPKHGDIVVIKVSEERSLIKRVIGLGGDKIRLENGVLYLNDEIVEEPYVNPEMNKDPKKNNFNELVIEEGYVFCMGDNRDNSEDSRGSYGPMPVEDIEGVVTAWSLQCKELVTGWNTFFEFTLPGLFPAIFGTGNKN